MQKRTTLLSVSCIVLLLGVAQWAAAQQGGRGRGFFGRGPDVVSVAAAPEVAAELEFSDEQTATAKRLSDEVGQLRSGLFQGFRDLSDEQRQAKLQEYREQTDAKEKELAQAVGEENFKRLQQLALQAVGIAFAVSYDETAEKLGLTEDQQLQIREARRALFEQLREAGGDAQARAKVMASMNEKTSKALNENQQKKWIEMIGEPASDELLDKIRAATFRGGGRRTT